jgi:HD-GYP domain-containing protein (c-di-GMP phosphodiesterase class II)
MQIGSAMDLEPERIKILKIAALLHDIGKVEIAESILNKREKLNDYEIAVLRRHPIYSANMLEPLSYINGLVEIVRAHHERYDGEGYPDRLSSTDIPLESRILAVADSYDAMLSNRPYRKGLGIEGAKQELRNCSGTQFDPDIVEVFLKELEVQEENKYTA